MWSCPAGEGDREGWRGGGGGGDGDGDGDRGERDFPQCRPVMRASNKVDVFMDN